MLLDYKKKEMLYIDVLEDESKKYMSYDLSGYNSRGCNILEFILKYEELKVTDLSKILNVKRQTVYNYFKVNTYQLPKIVIDKILIMYKQSKLDKLLTIFFIESYEDEITNEFDTLLNEKGLDLVEIENPYKKFIRIETSRRGYKNVDLNINYLYKNKNRFLDKQLLKDFKKFNEIYSYMEALVNRNTTSYNKQLIKLLLDIEPNDIQLIEHIKNYKKNRE